MQNRFVTVSTAARILHLSEGTVRKLERTGVLPAIRTESNIRLFELETVQRLAVERHGAGQSGTEAA